MQALTDYLIYFFAGCAVGAYGLDRGLLAIDGALARRWPAWLAVSVAGFVMWALPTSLMVDGRENWQVTNAAALMARDRAEMIEHLRAGGLVPHVSSTHALADVAVALREVAERRAQGKVLVVP